MGKENKEKLAQTTEAIKNLQKSKRQAAEKAETRKLIKDLKDAWPLMEMREKQGVLRRIIEKIVITDNKTEIFYKFS